MIRFVDIPSENKGVAKISDWCIQYSTYIKYVGEAVISSKRKDIKDVKRDKYILEKGNKQLILIINPNKGYELYADSTLLSTAYSQKGIVQQLDRLNAKGWWIKIVQ